MGGEGLKQTGFYQRKTGFGQSGGAKSAATHSDPELALVAEWWSMLCPADRRAILDILRHRLQATSGRRAARGRL